MYILSFQAESLVLRSIGPFYGQKEMLKEKILIVDDSEMNRSILADMLADEFEITEAENGVEAVSILQNHSNEYSLVLLDIVMPEMGGFDVLAVMNRFGWIEDVLVIMVSAETASSTVGSSIPFSSMPSRKSSSASSRSRSTRKSRTAPSWWTF